MQHSINLLKAYRNLDLVLSELKEIRTHNRPGFLEELEKTSDSKVVHASINNMTMVGVSYNIVTSMMEQIRNLGNLVLSHEDFDFKASEPSFDDLYKEYLECGPNDPCDAVEFAEWCPDFIFGLQCTHTDADGYGSALPMQVADAHAYWFFDTYRYTFVIPCPENFVEAYILRALDAFADMFGHDIPDVRPWTLLITDIPIHDYTYEELRDDYGFTWTDVFSPQHVHGFNAGNHHTDWFGTPEEHFAMYIDHHNTNPFYRDYVDKQKELPVGVYTFPTLGELKTIKGVGIPDGLTKAINEGTDELKIAATFITAAILDPLVTNATSMTVMDRTKYRENYYELCAAISQWDIFEWRDHPQFNPTSITPTMIGNMGFERPVYADINDLIDHLWNRVGGIHPEHDSFMPSKYMEALKEHDELLKSMARKLWAISAHVSSMNLGIRGHNAPDLWVVIPFPTVGNFSLVCHYMMQLDEYKKLKEDYTVGVMALDLMDSTISFRTDEKIEVARVDKLAKYYGGGGHPQASGVHHDGFASAVKLYVQSISECRKDFMKHPKMSEIFKMGRVIEPIENIE